MLHYLRGCFMKYHLWLSHNAKKERTSHGKVSCPFCVFDDFAVVSRIVDAVGVAEIMVEWCFCKTLAFRKQNGYANDKGGDCYGTNIKCICTSGT